MVYPQGWNFPQKVNLPPMGELCPLGGIFTTSFTPRGEQSQLLRKMEGQTENLTPRGKIPLGEKSTPRGQNSHLGGQLQSWGSKFAPRGIVKNGPQRDHMLLWKNRPKYSPQHFFNWITIFFS
jgi:hypothetical protein